MIPRKSHLIPLILAFSANAWAGEPVRFTESRAGGGVAAADPSDLSSLTVNPGAIALYERYDFQGGGSFVAPSNWEGRLGLVDSRSKAVALGVVYAYRTFEPPLEGADQPGWVTTGQEPRNRKRAHDVAVTVGGRAHERVSLGGSVSGARTNHDLSGKDWEVDLDAGIGVWVVEGWSVGLAGRDLIPRFNDDPATAVFGTQYSSEYGNVAADVEWQTETDIVDLRLGGTLEVGAARATGGYHGSFGPGTHRVSWGLGYFNERGGLSYTMQVPVGTKLGVLDLIHSIGVRVEG